MARTSANPLETLQAQLAELADQIASMQEGSPENPRKSASRTRKAAPVGRKRQASRKPQNVPAGCITSGMAHVMLGGDDRFTPRNPDSPATAKQLWVLNSRGMLTPAS